MPWDEEELRRLRQTVEKVLQIVQRTQDVIILVFLQKLDDVGDSQGKLVDKLDSLLDTQAQIVRQVQDTLQGSSPTPSVSPIDFELTPECKFQLKFRQYLQQS